MLLKKADFKFEPYSASGDSGALYLATRKADGKRFVIKQASPDCACNEFLYYSVAREMGLKTLDFYLFERDDECKTFRSGFAIAIEYLADARHIKSIVVEQGAVKNWKEYYKSMVAERAEIINWQEHFYHYALSRAFIEADWLEMLRGKDGFYIGLTPRSLSRCHILQ